MKAQNKKQAKAAEAKAAEEQSERKTEPDFDNHEWAHKIFVVFYSAQVAWEILIKIQP